MTSLAPSLFLGLPISVCGDPVKTAQALAQTPIDACGKDPAILRDAYLAVDEPAGKAFRQSLITCQTAGQSGNLPLANRHLAELAAIVRSTPVSKWSRILAFVAKGLEIKSYLDARSLPSRASPECIRPFSEVSEVPLHHLIHTPALEIRAAPLDRASAGFVRLFSDDILERSVRMVPEFIRLPAEGHPNPFVYARFLAGEQPTNAAHEIRRSWLTHSCIFLIDAPMGVRKYAIAEIGLFDDLRKDIDGLEALGHRIVGPELIVQTAEYHRQMGGRPLIPSEIHRRILKGAPHVENLVFSTREFDLILAGEVLRNCGGILWSVLPRALKKYWKQSFPLHATSERSALYFRNLLRLYLDGTGTEGSEEVFGRRTFSDLMGLWWQEEAPEVHRVLHGDVVRRFRTFLDAVTKWAWERRCDEGTVFYL
jgi:hypothetical protein